MNRATICSVEELPPGSKRIVRLDNSTQEVGVFNVAGEFHALANVCPHMHAPLCLGRVTGTTHSDVPHEVTWVREGEILRCPWHAWEFDIRSGRTLSTPPMRVRKYKVYVDDGMVVLEA